MVLTTKTPNAKNLNILITEYKNFYSKMLNNVHGNFGKIKLEFITQFKPIFDNEFGENGKLIKTLNDNEIASKCKSIAGKINNDYKVREGNIGDYSPWFKLFKRNQAFELEIPGQYTGKKKPILEYHVKIDSFDDRVNEK
jgi:DNA-dependent protein kinase catalytic subunit